MPRTQNRAVMIWIFTFASFAAFLVLFGGFVRLTRSGLSIVEWNPVSGTLPPLSRQAWQAEFAKYQQTPEYQKINSNMTLDQYKEIFVIEWLHRSLARLAGLVFALPFFIFVFRQSIPWRETGLYVVMGILFLAQAVMGWIMVSSGLVDRPSVSHYLLTAHLFLALTLIGLALWTALGHLHGFPDPSLKTKWSTASRAAAIGLVVLLIQMAYGGFTAGLKAGYVSDTWPLMFGQWIPQGLPGPLRPAALNLIEAPVTVVFIHRWFAFVGLIVAVWIYWLARNPERTQGLVRRTSRKQGLPRDLMTGINLVVVLVILQIMLGVSVVLYHVQIALALLHQANALALFATTVFVLHRLRAADQRASS